MAGWHRDFTGNEAELKKDPAAALRDGFGHGTHVAGIIAGRFAPDLASPEIEPYTLIVDEHVIDEQNQQTLEPRELGEGAQLEAIAPRCKLVSLAGAGR